MEEGLERSIVCAGGVARPEMMRPEDEWRPEGLEEAETLALLAMLEGCTQVEAAERAGVTDRTVRRWMERREFRLALREGRDLLLREVALNLHARARTAMEALCSEMQAPAAFGVSRVLAARTVLEFCLRSAEKVDHSERLREIEADVAAGKEALAKLEASGSGSG